MTWPLAVQAADVYDSWFTDVTSDEFDAYGYSSSSLSRPTAFPTSIMSTSYGTRGEGADISQSGYFSSATFSVASLTDKTKGAISFWICPLEDGKVSSGGKEHIILKGGGLNPGYTGFRISWDNEKGVLLFKMTGKKTINGNSKLAVCQYDISGWATCEWHHIQVAWLGRPDVSASSKGKRFPGGGCLP